MKKINYRKVKASRSYSVTEISKLLNVHTRTVRNWIRKEGLPVIGNHLRVNLIKGSDLKNHLIIRSKKQKTKLNLDEFYCLKCRVAVSPSVKSVTAAITEKVLGSGFKQIILSAECDNCNVKIIKFTSTKYLQELTNSFKQLTLSGNIKKVSYSGNTNRTLKD